MITKFKKSIYKNKINKFNKEIRELNFELNCVGVTKLQRIEVKCRKNLANKGIKHYSRKLNMLKECNNG